MKLELYYYEECPYCQRVLRTISELKIQIELKNTRLNSEHRDFHLKTTGMTQVPCLYIDGKPMFESLDIMNWLKENEAILKKA
jgi:glutaredoxin 3